MIEVKPGKTGYNQTCYLALKGTGRLASGQTLKLSLGETVVCGRSRHCDWSLKRTPAYLKAPDGDRHAMQGELAFKSVSRRHVRITFLSRDMVELENLSGNGTLVDGNVVDRIVLDDCFESTHAIQMGPEGPILELHPGSLPI